jgi:molecular chaperone GrpE
MQGESNSTNKPRDRRESDRESEGADDGDAIVDQGEAQTASEAVESSVESKVGGDPLAQAQAEAARLKDAWLRTAADFDNFRKRTRREVEDARRTGREDLLRVLLPVFDNLERALQSAQRSSDVKAMAEGLKMVERQFIDALGREGIARVPTVGHPFDPSVHEAIQQVETGDHEPGIVLAEVQPGYMQGDRLLRAAMVVVAKPKADDDTAAS